MKNKIKKFLFSETIKYILVGLLTTLINIVIFRLLLFIFNKNLPDFKYNWFLSEVPAFIIAVLFAFFMDKYFVFKKTDTKVSETIQELINFFMMRIISELVHMLGLFVFINILKLDALYSKIGLSVIVVVLNYLFSKFFIFRK